MKKLKRILYYINKKLCDLSIWLKKDEGLKNNISSSSIIKLLALVIPIYGILYLSIFYRHFNVNYFLYFNPLDFLRIFYANNTFIIVLILALSFVLIHLLSVFRSNGKKTPLKIIFLSLSLFELSIGAIIISNAYPQLRYGFFFLFILMLAVNLLVIYHKHLDIIIYGYIAIYLLGSIMFAHYEAIKIETNKYNFDIILNDDSYLLEESKKSNCKYFVGNITNYIFIYDCLLGKMRAIPMKNVKEIRFLKKN